MSSLGVLVFDKWTGNADARQSIFLRARLREYVPTFQGHALRVGFLAMMVDHGYIFNGPHWSYADSPLMGLYFRTSVYSTCEGGMISSPGWIASLTSRRK